MGGGQRSAEEPRSLALKSMRVVDAFQHDSTTTEGGGGWVGTEPERARRAQREGRQID